MLVLDSMEYATDEAIRAQYISSDIDPTWDELDEDCAGIGDWFNFDSGTGSSSVDPAGQFKMTSGANAGVSNYAQLSRMIPSLSSTFTVEIKVKHSALGSLANGDYYIWQIFGADEMFSMIFSTDGMYTFDTDSGAVEIGTDLVKYNGSAEWQTWRFLVTFGGVVGEGTCDAYLKDSTHDWEKVGTGIPCSYEISGYEGYLETKQYGTTTTNRLTYIDYFKIAGGLHPPSLECFSEDTTIQGGTYSLKGVAQATDSLNDTLTRTISPTLDLSDHTSWVFYIYSNRTGTNIKVGFHDSGGTTTEITPNVTSSGAWQKVEVDISGVANADKDAIDSITITIVDASSITIFYIDTMYATATYEQEGTSVIIMLSSGLKIPSFSGTTPIVFSPSSLIYHLEKVLAQYPIYSHISFLKNYISKFPITLDIRYKELSKFGINSDVRFNLSDYDKLELDPKDEFIIKLDGTTLTDVDIDSTTITLNLGSTPSEARMTLARRHDNYDKTLGGVASQISNENKIQIYDDTKLLFTGYITQINPDSRNDLVEIVAQDKRYKLNRLSPEDNLYYGYYNADDTEEIEADGYTIYADNKAMLTYILDYLVSEGHLNSYEEEYLDYFDVELEGTTLSNNYAELIETLIKEVATIDWYIDENEDLKFVKRGSGQTKTLSLASLDSQRHIYDVILNDIVLNRKTSTYTQGLLVKFGKQHNIHYLINDVVFPETDGELTFFNEKKSIMRNLASLYLQYGGTYFSWVMPAFGYKEGWYYQGEAPWGFYWAQNPDSVYLWELGWQSFWEKYQFLITDEYVNMDGEIVGVSSNLRTIFLNTYNKQVATHYYEERTGDDETWLWKVIPANYDFREYAKDVATLELYQNNKLLTTANVSLFVDAYEYFDLSFKNLINLDNTQEEGVYEDNNEFPLNIESISISLKDRMVTLNLTNYGGSFYRRVVDYSSCIYNSDSEVKLYKKADTTSIIEEG